MHKFPECSRMHAKSSKKFQNVPECMQKVPLCFRYVPLCFCYVPLCSVMFSLCSSLTTFIPSFLISPNPLLDFITCIIGWELEFYLLNLQFVKMGQLVKNKNSSTER